MTDKTTATALLPCPFCGAEADWGYNEDHSHFAVACKGCDAEISADSRDLPAGIAAWNRRAAPSPAPAAPSAAQPDYSHLRPEGGRFSFAYSPDTELPWVGWRFDDRDAAHFFRMELDALRNEEIFPAPARPAQDSLTEAAAAVLHEYDHPATGDGDLFGKMQALRAALRAAGEGK